MRLAKDLMTAKPMVLQSGAEVSEALTLFNEHSVHFVPIVTPMQEVLGLLSDFALAKACLLNYMSPQKSNKIISHKELLTEASYVDENETLEVVMRHLSKAPSNRLLVMNKQKRLVGVISPKDILRFLSGAEKRNKDLNEELKNATEKAESLKHQIKDLQSSLSLYKNAFEDSPSMMHSVDKSGVILMANEKIHEVLGYPDGELIGKPMSVMYPKTVLHEAISGLEEIKKKGFHHMTYTSMQKKSGEKIRIDITSSALRNMEGDFVGTISISRVVDAEALLRALNGVVNERVIVD